MGVRKGGLLVLMKVAMLYMGGVIGAGFASGQEIMQFFILHGRDGMKGVVLATVLFAYLGGLVMFLSVKLKSASYMEIIGFLLGPLGSKLMDVLNLIMLFGGLSVMLAGSAAVFGEQFGLPARAGVLAVALLTSAVVWGGLEGVLTASVFLVPLKFLAVSAISLAALIVAGVDGGQAAVFRSGGGVAGHWAPAGFLYVSYNMVVPVAVLASLGKSVSLRTGVAGGALGGLLLGLAVYLVAAAGLAYLPEAAYCQIPLLYLAGHVGPGFRPALGFLIWLAILTTAIASAHGIASRLAPEGGRRYRLFGTGSCLLAFPLSGVGFAGLVRLLYPVFGYAGLVLIISLLLVPVSKLFRIR
ncbi:MAG TPA: hypothetical protein PK728_08525 [Bacillota bacterium]|nr:hypothetical protein [Bacillota bacterium]